MRTKFSPILILVLAVFTIPQVHAKNGSMPSLYEARGFIVGHCYENYGIIKCSSGEKNLHCSLEVFPRSPGRLGFHVREGAEAYDNYGRVKFEIVQVSKHVEAKILAVTPISLSAWQKLAAPDFLGHAQNCGTAVNN